VKLFQYGITNRLDVNQDCDRQSDGQTNEQTDIVIANAALNHAAWPSGILCTPQLSYTYCGGDDDDYAGWQTSGTVTAEKLSATLNVTSSIQSTPS